LLANTTHTPGIFSAMTDRMKNIIRTQTIHTGMIQTYNLVRSIRKRSLVFVE